MNFFNSDKFDPEKLLPPLPPEESSFASEAKAREIGEKDGKERIPEITAYSPSQFELGLLSYGEQRVNRVVESAQESRARINKTLQPIISRLSNINTRWRNVRDRVDERKKELDRDFIVPLNKFFHWAIIIFLGFGEFPLNAIVFRMFGEPELMTYIMSSTLAVTIPLLAMYSGIQLRHGVPRLAGNIIVGGLMPVSIGGALGAVTYVRSVHLETGGHIQNAVGSDPKALGYSIFALNLLVFSAALVTSYMSHDPDEKLDHLRRSIITLERKRKPLLVMYSETASRLNAVLRVASARIEAERARTLSLIYLYRQANSNARSPNPVPLVFNRPPEFPQAKLWDAVTENPDDI